jgi:hypothetical protein
MFNQVEMRMRAIISRASVDTSRSITRKQTKDIVLDALL